MIINYIATFINLMITGLIASLGNLNADNDSEHSYSVFKGMVYLFGVITIFCSVYGNVLISLVTAFLGYYVLSDMAKLMHENAFLQWCGKNSIIVYVVHFSIVQGTRGILVRLLPLPMEILGWIVFVVAGLIVLVVGKICERHFMFAFGK